MPRLRTVLVAFALLIGAWGLAWVVVPLWLKAQVQDQGRAALGRDVRVDEVVFSPWTLELTIHGLRVAGSTPDGAPLLEVSRLYADMELQSIFRLAPVVDAVQIDQPRLRLRHLGDGRYDIDDMLALWARRPQAGGSAQFGLFNLALTGGELLLDDVPAGTVHHLRDLSVRVPFLSNLPAQRRVHTEPRVAFELNGSRFDTQASTLPFTDTQATRAQIRLPDLDLAPYLAYWPQALPVRLRQARIQADLTLQFEQQQTPLVQLSGRLLVKDLQVERSASVRSDEPWLTWDALTLVLTDVRPLARQVHLEHVALQSPRLRVSRDAQGVLDLGALFPASPADPPASQAPMPPWQVQVDRFDVLDGALRWRDAAVSPPWGSQIEAVHLTTGAMRWPVQAATPLEARAQWQGASLNLKGDVSLSGADLSLSWRDLGLSHLAPYVSQALALPLSGRSAGDVRLRWQAGATDGSAPGQPLLRLALQDLSLQDMALGPTAKPVLALGGLRLLNGSIDLGAKTAHLGQLSLSRPMVHVARNKAGRWMWDDWLVGAAAANPAPTSTPSPSPSPVPADSSTWRLAWDRLGLSDGSGRLDDAAAAEPVALRWSGLLLQLGAWRSDLPAEATVSMAARLATDGQGPALGSLAVDGVLGIRPASASTAMGGSLKARVKLKQFPAHGLAPYLADRLNLALLRADTSWAGDVALQQAADGLGVSAMGDLTVDDLRAVDTTEGGPLLDWKTLNLRGLRLSSAPGQPLTLSVAETALSDYFARIDIDPTGRINLQDLVRPPPAPDQKPEVVASSAGPVAQPPQQAQLTFGPITLVNGTVAFSDRFVRPNYSARLSEVTGGLGAFSNQGAGAAAPAAVSLRGRVEGTGSLDIEGQLNPLARPPVLDIRGRVRELELPPLSPYALKYTGHGIERGQLSVDVHYQVGTDGQLSASNQVTLNRLVFGDRAPDSDAPNLPVRLAVALLADRQGVIDINLPISGSLNDPEFRLGPIIGRLILGLIGKAVTAPFALLGNLFGGADHLGGQVEFVPGTDRLADSAAGTLAGLAKALNERPALQLTVVGHSDPQAERQAYQRERLQEGVRAEKRRQGQRAGTAAEVDPPVSAEEYPLLLRELYRRSDWPKPRNAIGLLKELSVPEMEALWFTHTPVADDALRELATRRAVVVKENLVARGLPGARVFVERAKQDGATALGAKAEMQLSLP